MAEDIIEPDVDVQFNYYIGDIEMKSSDENIYDEIPQNGNFELDINFSTVAYESASEILPAIIYVGVYDENDCLIALKSEEVTEDTLNVESCRIHVDETTNSISKIRAFIWDSLDGLRPLSEVFELSNSNEMS